MDLTRLTALGAHIRQQQDAMLAKATRDDALLAELGRHVALGRTTLRRTTLGRTTLRRTTLRRTSRKPRVGLPRLAAFAAAAMACLSVLLFFLVRHDTRSTPLAFTAGDPERAGTVGELLAVAASERLPLRFSDASRVVLDSGARARVIGLNARGAVLVLESGQAEANIVPRQDNDWNVRAGPVVVHVVGTRFKVGWDPARDEFSLELFEGKVELSGCAFGVQRVVNSGQRAQASCNTGELSIQSLSPPSEPPRTAAPTGGPAKESHEVTTETPVIRNEPGPADSAAKPGPSGRPRAVETGSEEWLVLARHGHYRRAYAQAVAQGFLAECEGRSADDVLLLGETARLAGQPEHAEQAYQAVRRRFAGSVTAAQAAFQLGRLAARAGQPTNAVGWFETYLREQPQGTLAALALGRLLEAQAALRDEPTMRETARIYLERYPSGAHAEAARRILQSGR